MKQLIERAIHVRFDGRSEELTAMQLNLANTASDAQIKHAVASHFDLPQSYLDDHVVVHTSTAIIVRPEAIYG
ncbi:MAG: hypothetical protein H0U76_13485 [Ktedonobacteraceae bacterium]|nr:hypothetical protein [Ktedonobacteraceae bacterium]